MKQGATRVPDSKDLQSKIDKNEIKYPFGVQNDLGHVVLTCNGKNSRKDEHATGVGHISPPGHVENLAHFSLYTQRGVQSPPQTSTPPGIILQPQIQSLSGIYTPLLAQQSTQNETELLSPHLINSSASYLSLQSSKHNSIASSLSELNYEAAVLERAIRTNDVQRVKKCFEKHRHRFQLLDRIKCKSHGEGRATRKRVSDTDAEENPIVFTNALHLCVEWGANDVLLFFLKEGLDPNAVGQLPDNYELNVGESRSASVSGWGSGCVFTTSSPGETGVDKSKIFSQSNSSSDCLRCVSPSATEYKENHSLHYKREVFKNLKIDGEEEKNVESFTNEQQEQSGCHSSNINELRPIISVIHCTSEERRRSSTSKNPAQIGLPHQQGSIGEDWNSRECRRMNRRVSWVSSLRENRDKKCRVVSGNILSKQKLCLPRQRSFSLESDVELRAVVKKRLGASVGLASDRGVQQSISLKNSPLHLPWHFKSDTSRVMREGGVFAELRRSSEIFRNILLSIAGKEESTPTDEEQWVLEDKELSFSSLLAAHGRRRSERSVSYSSCSWSDVSNGSELVPRRTLSINPLISKHLLLLSLGGREISFVDYYTSALLNTLPPLFLAASRHRITPLTLLLQHGAKALSLDSMGNTPLHLAVIQSPTPWDNILDLMEAGAKIGIKNQRSISPSDLLPSIIRLQKQLVADCWLGLVLEDASHKINENYEQGLREPTCRSSRLFKKLHEARSYRDKTDSRSKTAGNSTIGRDRVFSTSTIGNNNTTQGFDQNMSHEMETEGPNFGTSHADSGLRTSYVAEDVSKSKKMKLKRRKDKGSKAQIDLDPCQLEWSDLSKCLLTLKCLSSNEECLDDVLQGLITYTPSLLKRFQQVPPTTDVINDPHQCLSGLLHSIILVCVQCHTSRDEPKRYLSEVLGILCKSCLLLSSGPHPLQYTAMIALNKIIDISTVYRITRDSQETLSDEYQENTANVIPVFEEFLVNKTTKNKISSLGKNKSKENCLSKNLGSNSSYQDILEILEPAVGPIVNILHNAVTLFKRTIGSRQTCTPSVRRRSCSAHCLQLLSARLLVYLVHDSSVQKSLVYEAPLRIFIAALDATHDPILATLALEPRNHKPLLDAGVSEALPPLLLPADEFFYTNQTTLFPKYVKHHAARLLVYLGLHHRSALRVSVFDLNNSASDESSFQDGKVGTEDLFISWTCSSPPPVIEHSNSKEGPNSIIAISVESLLIRVLGSIEVNLSTGSPHFREPFQNNWIYQSPNRNSISLGPLHNRRHSAESRHSGVRDIIGGPELDPAIVSIFQTCFPALVHPTILLRLLFHRLLTTGLTLRRWKSCASRASFASAYSAHSGHSAFSILSADSRTSRSRASSTDESIPLRRRRQVSLTVDCGLHEDDEQGVLEEEREKKEEKPEEEREIKLEDIKRVNSGGGSSIRAILSKWRTSSQEATVDKTGESSGRESSLFGLLPLAGLRTGVSKESLQIFDSPLSSHNNTPLTSPSYHLKQSFRFGSMHQRKSRRLSRNRSLDVTTEPTSPKVKPEDEIIAFQKRLQNLPDFLERETNEPSSTLPPTSPRPRSRSVPKVRLEAPRLELSSSSSSPPPTHGPNVPHLLSPSCPQRGSSLNGLPPSPPSLTFLSPLIGGRKEGETSSTPGINRLRNESLLISDIPLVHRAVLMFVEDWITTCLPFGRNSYIIELRDFVSRVSSCGPPYLRWADHIRMQCPLLAYEEDVGELESLEGIESEYLEMQRLVVSGSLPCNKEEASVLAGIQLRLEECWPRFSSPRPVFEASLNFPQNPTTNPHTKLTENLSLCTNEGEMEGCSLTHQVEESPRHVQMEEYRKDMVEEEFVTKKTGMGRAVSLLTSCYSSSTDKEMSLSASTKIEDLVPPYYVHAGNMHRLIKEQKRKLFHTSVYESATQLQKLYVQTCRRLPAYNCRLVVVKELLRGKTKKKATRLLGIGPDKIILLDCRTKILAKSQLSSDLIQWRAGGGRNHDRLILEFRSTKWSLIVPPLVGSTSSGSAVSCGHLGSVGGLREAGRALWALLRQMDTQFIDEFTIPVVAKEPQPINESSNFKKRWKIKCTVSGELEQLEKVLHFPEEVALSLANTESDLFSQVAPLEYLRHVTMDASSRKIERQSGDTSTPLVGVSMLVDRFNEISSWTTHLLVSPPSHEERKAMLSCLLRVARAAWNLGAFGTAVEVIAGLKSSKLKPFWLSLHVKEDIVPTLDILTKALLGETIGICGVELSGGNDLKWSSPIDYEAALHRALKIPTCPVVPFFGTYLKELRSILNTSSLVVLTPGTETSHQQSLLSLTLESEDDFFTKIGPGGLLNMNKLRKVQLVLEKISSVHQHINKLPQRSDFLHADRLSIHTSSIERSGFPEEELSTCSKLTDEIFGTDLVEEMSSAEFIYEPVQPLAHDHSVSFIPFEAVDVHTLQILHHGTTALHVDSDGRSGFVWVKLERSCGTISWSKPVWSSLRFSHASPDFLLSVDCESIPLLPGLLLKYGSGSYGTSALAGSSLPTPPGLTDIAGIGIEDGYIDLSGVKEVEAGSRELDISAAMKRYGIESWCSSETCLSLVYGMVLSDNRTTAFVFPPRVSSIWLSGLRAVIKSLRRVLGKPDRRLFWLKEQYLQLYYEDGRCLSPSMAESIRIFGGRRWSSSTPQGTNLSDTPPFKRTASAKFKKKKSLSNIHMIKESLVKPNETVGPEAVRPLSPSSRSKAESFSSTPSHQPQSVKSALSIINSSPQARVSALTHETRLSFLNFVSLFQAFSLRSRKDLRDLFDSIATVQKTEFNTESSQPDSPDRSHSSSISGTAHKSISNKLSSATESKFIYDAIASASIVQNGAGVETSRGRILSLLSFSSFLKIQQGERKTETEIKALINKFEPDESLKSQSSFSFEGFARYMMSAHNLAFVSERIVPEESELDHPLAHYFIAASHNTYLTGHQLKGESSVELYSQVLLTGCRCVELDCWDGDDGDPVIYHGHTFTTKIPFRQVVDAINKSAFLASSYPVILSIENHCSLQQQARMAWTFQTVFGDKLVSRFLFDSDFGEDPLLPSPAQLKNRILIKNKKIYSEIILNPTSHVTIHPPQPAQNIGRNRSGSRPYSGRTNSIISNVSGGSINDEYSDDDVESDYDDDILDERIVVSGQETEQALPIALRTDSLTSQESSLKSSLNKKVFGSGVEGVVEWGGGEFEESFPKAKKQSSQIARELSDLIIYLQAIKFRGLTTLSPSSSVRNRGLLTKTSKVPLTPNPNSSEGSRSRANINHPVYQCSSLNENATKKLCRKQPLQVIAHTETQLIRAYPAGMRIDSSNFNPLIFWSFGIQMVALNYQTEDAHLHLNAAMFEQNGRCGYVLKPPVMWDRNHVMYRRFNPLEKEFDGLHTINLELTVISGQFLCPTNYQASLQVEAEVNGIPVDCCKQKTSISVRNALNPIWNETLSFRIQFRELCFIRFSIIDGSGGGGSGHVVAQRVIPLTGLRQGYRHLRLRNIYNQPLPISTIFIHSRIEEEGEEFHLENNRHYSKDDSRDSSLINSPEGTQLLKSSPSKGSVGLKRRMFFLVVHGVMSEEPYTILKVTQDTRVSEVISSALLKSGRPLDSAPEYVLIEEVARGWDTKEKNLPPTQRVLGASEKPLQAQSLWKGDGKFILKRTGNDPSSRAWLSSISTRGGRDLPQTQKETNEAQSEWAEEDNFLVCVHNVSPEIPYAILKVPVRSNAQDIIAQAFVKSRRLEDPTNFALVEELEPLVSTGPSSSSEAAGSFRKKSSQRSTYRVLKDDENIYELQLKWNNLGRFVLRERKSALSLCGSMSPTCSRPGSESQVGRSKSRGIRAATLARLTKLKMKGTSSSSGPHESKVEREEKRERARHYLAERQAMSLHDTSSHSTTRRGREIRKRDVHSEGETLTDEDSPDTDFKATISRLKKLSMKKFRAWKS